MSKIQVDAIEQQTACGTTLTAGGGAGKTVVVDATTVTLGRCGGTVALASGASQTGFGRTGTVDWQTTPKTATFTAVSGEGYFANTTGSAFNMNLPAGVAGAIVSVADYAATFQTNALTVVPNGTDKIGSLNENAILNVEGQSVTFVFVDSTQGWINTMDSTSNVRGASFICASVSGACNTLTTSGNCKVATFTGPGTFTVNSTSSCAANNEISYIVVAGGAGGGDDYGGGGGAGGFREDKSPITPYTASPLDGAGPITVTATGFPITVGAGGAAGPSGPNKAGSSGVNSVFSTITSAGGGGGGGSPSPAGVLTGGSGGGGGAYSPLPYSYTSFNPGAAGNTPPVSPPQGNTGGKGVKAPSGVSAGGGGGATAVGGDVVSPSPTPYSTTGGPGGAGATTSISGSPTAYSGGGGGASEGGTTISGGIGGGGTGRTPASGAATNGTGNTGGGGGGGFSASIGAGGSGIVIIRYKFQ
jgi:hypothetical protein